MIRVVNNHKVEFYCLMEGLGIGKMTINNIDISEGKYNAIIESS